jgi:RNA polymerase sigma-70 factor, ECF subfamily
VLGQDFDQILQAARASADWAWALIYGDLSGPVLGYLRGRGSIDPEGVTGEVFLQVVRDLPSFDGDERAFRTWVLSVGHHRLLDEARYWARRPVDAVVDDTLITIPSGVDVEGEALGSAFMVQVRRFIARLSPDQQDVLLLRLVGELTVEEVAQALGKRQGAVRALQRRGLATLRREISREGVAL